MAAHNLTEAQVDGDCQECVEHEDEWDGGKQ